MGFTVSPQLLKCGIQTINRASRLTMYVQRMYVQCMYMQCTYAQCMVVQCVYVVYAVYICAVYGCAVWELYIPSFLYEIVLALAQGVSTIS